VSRSQSRTADFYADPLVYDVLHAPGTRDDVSALLRIVRQFVRGRRPLRLLEPACGSGRFVVELAARGHHAAGFDRSARMVTYAKARAKERGLGPRARFFPADMRTFARGRRLPPFDVAFNLINSIRHLPSDAAMVEHLRQVRSALRPGGVYLVGLSLCAYGLESETEDVWRGARGPLRVTQVVQYLPPPGREGSSRNERVVSHMTVTRRGLPPVHVDSTYQLRGYDLEQWRRVAARAGMPVVACVASDGRRRCEPVEPGYYVFALGGDPTVSAAR
jgi:SAM-dependent methyltransferase